MTLESGLDELSSLHQLELVHVGHITHKITVAELNWMNKAWPRLRSLVGLFGTCADPLPGVCEWFQDNDHIGWVPENERIQLFCSSGKNTSIVP